MIEISLALTGAAFIAGVLMFLAPCTLPLVPAYLAFIAGVNAPDTQTTLTRSAVWRIRINALLFVCGFSVTFVVLGALAGWLGSMVAPWQSLISQIGGVLIIFFGVTLLGLIKVSALERVVRFRLPRVFKAGDESAALALGVLFALGWSPCIGPVLATVLVMASTSATLWSGVVLLAVFSLGLALPFLAVAWWYARVASAWPQFSRRLRYSQIIGAVLLIILGVLMVTNTFGLLITYGYTVFSLTGMEWIFDWY